MNLDVFNSNDEANKLLNEIYSEDNFEIINLNNKNGFCYVFFSSNGLYSTRTSSEAIKDMHNKRRFEWQFIAKNKRIMKRAKKIIFLRDIYKAFYVNGINSRINSIDSVLKFLKNETNGMKAIMVGSSAGAYMALLAGGVLKNTVRIICTGGIMSLYTLKTFTTVYENVVKETNYPIVSTINSRAYYINVFGKHNQYDFPNNELLIQSVNHNKLLDIGFDSDKHGVRPDYLNLVKLLVCNNKHIDHLIKNKTHINGNNQLTFYNLNIYEKLLRFRIKLIKRIRKIFGK